MNNNHDPGQWRTELLVSVIEAIDNLQESRGSTITNIVSYIRENTDFQIPRKNLRIQVRKVLKDAVKAGILSLHAGRYGLERRRHSFIVANMKNRWYYTSGKRRKTSRSGRSDKQSEKKSIANKHSKRKQPTREKTVKQSCRKCSTKRDSSSVSSTSTNTSQGTRRSQRLLNTSSRLPKNTRTKGQNAQSKTITESHKNSLKGKRKTSTKNPKQSKKQKGTRRKSNRQTRENSSDVQTEQSNSSWVTLRSVRVLLTQLEQAPQCSDTTPKDVSDSSDLPRMNTPLRAVQVITEPYSVSSQGTLVPDCTVPPIEDVYVISSTELGPESETLPQHVLTPHHVVPVSATEDVSAVPVVTTTPVVSLWNNPIPRTSSILLTPSVSTSKEPSSSTWSYGMPGQMQWSCPVPGDYTEDNPTPSSSIQTHQYTWSIPTPIASQIDNLEEPMTSLPSYQPTPLFINPNPQTLHWNDPSVNTIFNKPTVSILNEITDTSSVSETVKPQENDISEMPKFDEHSPLTNTQNPTISMFTNPTPLLNNERKVISSLSKPTTSLKRKISESIHSTIEQVPFKQQMIVSPVFTDSVTIPIPQIAQTSNTTMETESSSMLVNTTQTVTENTPTYVMSPGQNSTVTVMSVLNNTRSVSSTGIVPVQNDVPKDSQMSEDSAAFSGVNSSNNLPPVLENVNLGETLFTTSASDGGIGIGDLSATHQHIDTSISNTSTEAVHGNSSSLSMMSTNSSVKSLSSEDRFPVMSPTPLKCIEEDDVSRSSSDAPVRESTSPGILVFNILLDTMSDDNMPSSSGDNEECMPLSDADSGDNMEVPIGLILKDLLSTMLQEQMSSSSPVAQGSVTMDSTPMEVDSDNKSTTPVMSMFNNPVSAISEDRISTCSTSDQESRPTFEMINIDVTSRRNDSVPIISGFAGSVSSSSVTNDPSSSSSASVQGSVNEASMSDSQSGVGSETNGTVPITSIFQNNPVISLSADSVPAPSMSEQGRVISNIPLRLADQPFQVESCWFLPRPENSSTSTPMSAISPSSAPGLLVVSDVPERPDTYIYNSSTAQSRGGTMNTPSFSTLGMSIEREPQVSTEDCNNAMIEQDADVVDDDASTPTNPTDDIPTEQANNENTPERVNIPEKETVEDRPLWS